MKPKCLLTGASGFLGRALRTALASEYEVFGLRHAHPAPGLKAIDLRDSEALSAVIKTVQPDVVVHAAAYRDPDFCEVQSSEARLLNVEPARVLAGKLDPACRLLYISTDYVFDGERPPYAEEAKPHPVNIYGQTKLLAEEICLARTNSLSLRIPLLCGAGPDWTQSGFIYKTAQVIESGASCRVDDEGMRYPTWIVDVAEAVRFLLPRKEEGVFHHSSRRGATRYKWTLELAELMGLSVDHLTPAKPGPVTRAKRPPDSHLSTSRLEGLGFDRFTDFAEVANTVLKQFDKLPSPAL